MEENKLSFWELLNSYTKIEIPIIQRDYAQGRKTEEVGVIRKKFIHDFLIKSILNKQSVELDFVYGSILEENVENEKLNIFIPLDGQQRLTTLFLLHYFIGVKEKELDVIKEELSKFTYETRPSTHDFCSNLINFKDVKSLQNIKNEILDSAWFNYEWINDPTVSGMLNMLDTFAKHKELNEFEGKLLPRLLDKEDKLISFYFTELTEFGLTENLYIRMNARGKSLNDFENFKSEFFKIIQYNNELQEIVKDKIEYDWVENLWSYRLNDSFIIDQPFLKFVSFISEMLYFKSAEYRLIKGYKSNFLDFDLLKALYSKEENLRFLIFALDQIKVIQSNTGSLMYNKESLKLILANIINGKKDTNEFFVLYASLSYNYKIGNSNNLMDYLRVIRNLINNTPDNSRREWPRLIKSMENLISEANVYKILSEDFDSNLLIGFNSGQRTEEVFKAKIFISFPDFKLNIQNIEDHKNFEGNITNILIAPFADSEYDFNNLNDKCYSVDEVKKLLSIFKAYEKIATNNFNVIWGDLIDSRLYSQTYNERLVYNTSYEKHPAIIYFAKKFSIENPNLDLVNYLKVIKKTYLQRLNEKYSDYSEITNVKEQLTLYYIYHSIILKKTNSSFFKNSNYNFGWLRKENGFKSHFNNGISESSYFEISNPIYQVYNYQFRYNLGLNRDNTLDIEIIDSIKRKKPLDLLLQWSLEKDNNE